ncbi:MAG: RagB/SusD family nutrient uptake outer membrane protein [Paludibacter sp.]|nr:RagB/SusD family nutrient uptake outer membrane protein [Paludibacter sp.]
MKKIFFILSIIAVTLTFSACEDSLNIGPEDYYGSNNFWNNEAQVKGFMYGIHSTLRYNYGMFFYLGEARGGTHRTGTSSQNTSLNDEQIKISNIDKNNTGISNWYNIYNRLLNINLFIIKVEDKEATPFLTDDARNGYLAQAYAFRALYYFFLYRTYGNVPLVTTVEVLNGRVTANKFYIPRATAKQTLELIKSDINKSETLFGNSTALPSRIEWSVYATKMLKAEIYLWAAKVPVLDQPKGGNADLTVAKTALQSVIGNANFSLISDFSKIFSDKTVNNKEVIFSLRFLDKEAYNNGGEFLYQDQVFVNQKYDRNGNLLGDVLNLKSRGGIFRHEYKFELFQSYDANDIRRDATFFDYYSNNTATEGKGLLMKKAVGSINSTGDRVFDTDYIVYRYADALLLMAEIENGLTGSCATYINEVRKRAYGANYGPAVAYADGTFAVNELAILKERDKEFVWEGKRWFDVVRLRDAAGKSLAFSPDANYPAGTPLIPAADTHKLLWPVDVYTLNLNPELTQTTGYN